jgi:hypothetical protein
MQQGLAFYQHRKLLRVLILFNSSEVPELLVRYAWAHHAILAGKEKHTHHIQAYKGNK